MQPAISKPQVSVIKELQVESHSNPLIFPSVAGIQYPAASITYQPPSASQFIETQIHEGVFSDPSRHPGKSGLLVPNSLRDKVFRLMEMEGSKQDHDRNYRPLQTAPAPVLRQL